MNRLTSHLFLIIFIWQLAGFFVYFEIERNRVRKDIKQLIKNGSLKSKCRLFNFTQKEFNNLTWINDHEFKMNGHMYDVVKKNKNKHGYSVSCIDDTQETRLFAELDDATNSNLNNQSEKAPLKSFEKLLNAAYLEPFMTLIDFATIEFKEQSNHFFYQSLFSQFKKQKLLQPPKDLV